MSQLIRAGQGASCRASGSAPLLTRLLQARRSPASADRCIAQSLIAPRRVHALKVDMRRQMERGRVWLWSAAGVGIVAITLAGCGRTGIAGCDAQGVKKAPYVAKNRAIFAVDSRLSRLHSCPGKLNRPADRLMSSRKIAALWELRDIEGVLDQPIGSEWPRRRLLPEGASAAVAPTRTQRHGAW